LGTEGSVVNPGTIDGLPVDLIEGGASRGANLFHSFEEFNVRDGQRVYFANPAVIENILSRVTGTDASDILGTLGVNGGANLFLLNPNGIIFGENARLDIKGSFVAATANSILFENGIEYSAINPEAPPLLTVTVPIGLQYGTSQSREIVNQGNLTVGENFTLSADNLTLTGQLQAGGNLNLQAQDTVQVRDSVERPFIAAAGGTLLVEGNQGVDIFALNHPDSGFYSGGDMVLRSANTVGGDAHYWSGGNFRIEKLDGTLGDLSSPDDPIIASANDVELGNYAGASLHILAGGRVRITGNIEIDSTDNGATSISPNAPAPYNEPAFRTITLSDNSTTVSIDGSARPTLDIRAGIDWTSLPGGIPGNTILFTTLNPNPIFGTNPTNADIEINGNIQITEPDGLVFLTNQYNPNGLSGDIQVGRIDTGSTVGNGGSVFLDSRSAITITGTVDSSSFTATDNGGNITLLVKDKLSLSNDVTIRNQINGSGIGGDINVKAKSVSLTDGARIWTINEGNGQGGNITITATDFVEVIGISASGQDSSLASIPTGTGSGGNIKIETGRLIIRDGAAISTAINGAGQGGNLTVITSESVELSGAPTEELYSGLFAGTLSTGNSGDITIQTKRLILQDGGQVAASSHLESNGGSAGNLTVFASESVEVLGRSVDSGVPSGLYTFTFGFGEGGNLTINTGRFLVRDRASVAASTNGNGDAGDLKIVASESMEVINAEVRARTTFGLGNAGDFEITTGKLIIRDGALVSASTFGPGDAGDLKVNATEFVQVIGTSEDGQTPSRLFVDAIYNENDNTVEVIGDAGDLKIKTGSLIVQDGGQVSATTADQGKAGNLEVEANLVEVIGTSANGEISSRLLFDTVGSGNAGELTIDTNRLIVKDGGLVSATTSSTGEAGILDVNASDSVQIIGTSANGEMFSSLLFDTSGSGNAGLLTINTNRLIVQDGAKVSAMTSSTGEAGKLTVNAADSVQVIGTAQDGQTSSSLLFNSSGSGEGGNAGELTIDTNRLIVKDGGLVSATTSSTGEAGILDVNASDSVQIIGTSTNGETPSRLLFDSSGAGNAGELTIDTNRLLIQDGGQVSAATSGSGQGGIIDVNAADSVDVSGTSTNGQFASGLYFDSRSSGNARGIKINTGELTVQNGGQISVSGSNSGISGDLDITADSISLTNQGHLITTTAATEGGNIRLNVNESVILRDNSEISAEASNNGNGGNIDITAGDFILAILSENSDIVANAYAGNGGNINATAAGVFGFRQFEERRTPESDFIASSFLGIDGTTTINTQDVQPVPLPEQPGVPPISEGCQANRNPETGEVASSQFYNTGRGGLPPNPSDALTSNTPQVPWVTLEAETQTPPAANSAAEEPLTEIAEAQGWVRLPNGEVMLTTQTSDLTNLPYCVFGSHE
jgi:filamentous hemagglutinin family protein